MSDPICPNCGSGRIHHSRRRTLTEKLIAPAGGKVRRCHACNWRFVQLGGSLIRTADFRAALRGVTFATGLVLAAALLLAAIIWIGRTEASPMSEPHSAIPASLRPATRPC